MREVGRTQVQNLFTSAAESALGDAESDPSVRRAARHFLSFAMAYNDWDLDALGRPSATLPTPSHR